MKYENDYRYYLHTNTQQLYNIISHTVHQLMPLHNTVKSLSMNTQQQITAWR